MTDEHGFARQHARTRRFSLGAPRGFSVAPDGSRVVFLRSSNGTDPVNRLWELAVDTGAERLVVDTPTLLGTGAEELTAAERARRERLREQASGIVAYATDRALRTAVFGLSGRLFTVDLASGATTELAAAGAVFDPRLDPAGELVAYAHDGALRVIGSSGQDDRELVGPESPEVSYGLAEHVAGESMQRVRGFWWAPDSTALAVARVDNGPVEQWYIADPANPATPATAVRYPAAGTANAEVSLFLVGLDGNKTLVQWDRAAFEYLADVSWSAGGLVILVQSRDQRRTQVLAVDPRTGVTSLLRADSDEAWLEVIPGVPGLTASGDLVTTVDDQDTRRLVVGDAPVSPVGVQLRSVIDIDGDEVLFSASTEPTEVHLWRYSPQAGAVQVTSGAGVHSGRQAGGTLLVSTQSLDHFGPRFAVLRDGVEVATIANHAETPVLAPRVELIRCGEKEIRTAVLLPSWHEVGSGPLPVLLDPYGGPHGQRVLSARSAHLVSQWFAEQGFAVLVADGRGTPARGPAWERSIRFDKLDPVLEDQVDALHSTAKRYPDLDLERVAIRGWSYGGYLAAAAVLRRPDVFHAAVAGAPVTDPLLYDTHWMERYLGDPDQHPDAYERCSLIPDAPKLSRPLMLVHGLADDNVVAAHTLRLSSALLAAGRPHTVLPLSGVTHMTPQEEVAENLLLLQVRFLKESLGITD